MIVDGNYCNRIYYCPDFLLSDTTVDGQLPRRATTILMLDSLAVSVLHKKGAGVIKGGIRREKARAPRCRLYWYVSFTFLPHNKLHIEGEQSRRFELHNIGLHNIGLAWQLRRFNIHSVSLDNNQNEIRTPHCPALSVPGICSASLSSPKDKMHAAFPLRQQPRRCSSRQVSF